MYLVSVLCRVESGRNAAAHGMCALARDEKMRSSGRSGRGKSRKSCDRKLFYGYQGGGVSDPREHRVAGKGMAPGRHGVVTYRESGAPGF